jgi:hypothetical protein
MTDAEFWALPVWAAYIGAAVKLGRVVTLPETVRVRTGDDCMWVALTVDGKLCRTPLYPHDWKPMVTS